MNQYPESSSRLPFHLGRKLQLLPGYSGLYLTSAFRNLAMSLISLFIPLYILKLTQSIESIFIYYALYHAFVVLFVYPVAIVIRCLGIDFVSVLGTVGRVLFIYFLVSAEIHPMNLWWSAIAWGLTVPLSWLPFHYAFTVAEQEDGKYGKEVSRLQIIYKITGFIGPAAGGIMIALYGFQVLYALAIILTIVSGFPLVFDRIKAKGMRLSFTKISRHLARRERRKFWFSFAGGQLEAAVIGLAWPLFIYLTVNNYEILGLIKSAAIFVSIILVWSLGKWIDNKGKSILSLGTVINSFNVLVRPFLSGVFALFLIDSAYSLTSDLVATPFESAFYEEAVKMRKLEFMTEREFVIHFSGMFACLLVGILFYLKAGWFYIFSLAAVGLMLENYILMNEPDRLSLRQRLFLKKK